MKQYVLTRTVERAKEGQLVWQFARDNFGLANEDTRHNDTEYVAVCFNKEGDYPFVTVPKNALKEYNV